MTVDRCDECSFVYDESVLAELDVLLRRVSDDFADLLDGDVAPLRRRPAPEVWSTLEYSCHVRDVLLAQRERLYLTLVEDEPSFASIYRDHRVVLARYNDHDPGDVARELSFATHLFAGAFTALDGSQRSRTCIYNYPEPMVRTVDWLALHTLHECRHHLADARRSLRL
jgi:hypothetical protein